ncbi:coiled-coil domain-containing protein 60 isoform X2 [Microcaecilia unicolor]|uniref:Coiled-coil domain-containing protein 60 isoform X2 n=1 Tax=Microcaecilia unicolor TaxID=1415580 RepID=A0A6P7ZCD3_9AMPH|nr:coiled-coil domain-containing protein 60 isoform X2 [Microcaecilia unicolor]
MCLEGGEMPWNQRPHSYLLISPLPTSPPKGLKIIQGRQQLPQAGQKAAQEQGQPLCLQARKLAPHSLGQEAKIKESTMKEDLPVLLKADTVYKGSLGRIRAVNIKHREKDLKSFSKNLLHTRQLISAVKKGQGYFHLLKKEEEDEVKMKTLLAEKQRLQLQSHGDVGDAEKEETSMMDSGQASFLQTDDSAQKNPERKERRSTRPFTPVFNSLFSDRLSEADPMSLFRQLCALHWLLEALNGESSNATTIMTPVCNCWNSREPGGNTNTLRRINKEKAVEQKWEQFVTAGKTKKFLQKSMRSQYFPRRKSSFMSVSRFSGLSSNHTPTMGSMSSLTDYGIAVMPTSEGYREGEDSSSMASSSLILLKASREDDDSVSDSLRILREMIQAHVARDLALDVRFQKIKLAWTAAEYKNQDKICNSANDETDNMRTEAENCKRSPLNNDSAASQFIKGKSSLCLEMRRKFSEVADEAVSCLNKNVKAMEGRRQLLNAQKFNSLRTVTNFQKDLDRMRKPFLHVKQNCSNSKNWLFSLFSRIPDDVKKIPKIQKILRKLEKFGEIEYEGIRPRSFLKMLSGLRTWELCSPDLCVAIEFVRENLVRMSENDYAAWLHSQVPVSSRSQSAPPMG